jgi:hypothetical protein
MFEEENYTSENEGDYEFDEIRGAHGRKPKMAVLNKTKLSKYEMDDLFTSEDAPDVASED